MSKKVTLLRHAKVQKKYINCYNGWNDIDIDISCDNKKIADLKIILRNNNFDKIYSSDLIRCQNTLKILGFKKFKTMKEFREIRFNDFAEGKNFNDIQKEIKIPNNVFNNIENWTNFIAKESLEEFTKRVKNGISKLEGDNILLCTHGGVINTLIAIYLKEELFNKKINYLDFISINLSLTKN